MHFMQSRRDFLASAPLAAAAHILSTWTALAEEGTPVTTLLRLPHDPAVCLARFYVAGGLLQAEGFTDIRYIAPPVCSPQDSVSRGEMDFDLLTPAWAASHLNPGDPVPVLAGGHSGFLEPFAREPFRTISLKSKKIAVEYIGSSSHGLLTPMANHIGLDSQQDIEWVASPEAMELFAEGKVDASLVFAPEPQVLRSHGFKRVILNTDKPWSQYVCCMMVGMRALVDAGVAEARAHAGTAQQLHWKAGVNAAQPLATQ